MTNFKLIAITPLKNCDEKYSKKLEKGLPNLFYNGYTIELSTDKNKIVKVTKPKNPVPQDLYKLQNGIDLSISAVVGKNGSGKSSIFELFFYTVYIIYTQKKIDGERILKKESSELTYFHKKLAENTEKIISADSSLESNKKIIQILEFANLYDIKLSPAHYVLPNKIFEETVKKAKLKLNSIKDDIEYIKKEESAIENGLAVSILYESDGIINEVVYDRGEFRHCQFNPQVTKAVNSIHDFNPEDFFYSISINYSLHGLNSNFIGTWINRLFHKNDAYKTPVVINPMRNEGNFNVNTEQHLAKERLMANALYDLVNKSETKLLEKYTISEFVFKAKLKSAPVLYPEDLQNLTCYSLLNDIGIDDKTTLLPFFDYAISYLEHKINRVQEHYHFIIYHKNKPGDKQQQFLQFLKEDSSHITKKIRQVLNFLKTSLHNQDFWQTTEDARITLDRKGMKTWLELSGLKLEKLTPYELIEIGLPGFFYIDFKLLRGSSRPIDFAALSSGEQQIILNLNGLLYHLANLNSIVKQSNKASKTFSNNTFGRIIYKDINIILDEVELYYHPEMQRKLISELLVTFEKVKRSAVGGIKSINVSILTHSPFILSDIPAQNVLSLTDEKSSPVLSETVKTFGGNIQEILMEQFFMDSTLGEHSIQIMQSLIGLYEQARRVDNKEQRIQLKKDNLKLEKIYEFTLENVGEEVIREVLKNNLQYILFIIKN